MILDMQTQLDLTQALPKGIPTLVASNSGNHTSPDNVFVSHSLTQMIATYTAMPDRRPAKTDHIPILTILDTKVSRSKTNTRWNYKRVDWKVFQTTLKCNLAKLTPPCEIDSAEGLQHRLTGICEAINDTVKEHVPRTRPCPKTKRWWSNECTTARQALN